MEGTDKPNEGEPRQIIGGRAASQRTVRQQVLAVYGKSGLTDRTDLAAFFLEDLLLPAQPVYAICLLISLLPTERPLIDDQEDLVE